MQSLVNKMLRFIGISLTKSINKLLNSFLTLNLNGRTLSIDILAAV